MCQQMLLTFKAKCVVAVKQDIGASLEENSDYMHMRRVYRNVSSAFISSFYRYLDDGNQGNVTSKL